MNKYVNEFGEPGGKSWSKASVFFTEIVTLDNEDNFEFIWGWTGPSSAQAGIELNFIKFVLNW